jgi:hypothetical protein
MTTLPKNWRYPGVAAAMVMLRSTRHGFGRRTLGADLDPIMNRRQLEEAEEKLRAGQIGDDPRRFLGAKHGRALCDRH